MAGITDIDKRSEYEEIPSEKPAYILAVDVGTTSMRSYIYDRDANIKGQSLKKVSLLNEFRPYKMWIHN
jgi:glycerol kinase